MRIATLAFSVALASAAFAVTPALASDKTDAMATITQFNDAANKADMKAGTALCADQASIVDAFAPYSWHSCTDWWNAFNAFAKNAGMSSVAGTLGKSVRFEVVGDRAYAVIPASFAYKLKGKPMTDSGLWTFALQKLPAGWRITGFGWALQSSH
jgi:hypothetical protein